MPKHRIVTPNKNYKYSIAESYTTKKCIRITKPIHIDEQQLTYKRTILENSLKFQTKPISENQYKFLTILPSQKIEEGYLQTFFKNNGIFNESQYRIFKLFENISFFSMLADINNYNQILLQKDKFNLFTVKYLDVIGSYISNSQNEEINEIFFKFNEDLDYFVLQYNNFDNNNINEIKKDVIDYIKINCFLKEKRTEMIINGARYLNESEDKIEILEEYLKYKF